MKKKKMMLIVVALATVLLCVTLSGCEEPKDEQMQGPTAQPTTQPTTQPEETTTGGGSVPEPPGPDSGIVERPTDPTELSKPTEPTPPTDPPEEEQPIEPPKVEEMTYKKYEALSEEEKMTFQSTFASRKAFLNWYKAAKQEYEDSQQHVTIGPGAGLDIGDYIK